MFHTIYPQRCQEPLLTAFSFILPRMGRMGRISVLCVEEIDQKVCSFPLGLRPCSLMCMLSQVSELPCLTIPIRLVCPQADRKASKQNSCPWQYKMSLQRRLLTVTSDLPGACPMAYCPPGSICGMLSIPRALPPVTQSSALQAPERLRIRMLKTSNPW